MADLALCQQQSWCRRGRDWNAWHVSRSWCTHGSGTGPLDARLALDVPVHISIFLLLGPLRLFAVVLRILLLLACDLFLLFLPLPSSFLGNLLFLLPVLLSLFLSLILLLVLLLFALLLAGLFLLFLQPLTIFLLEFHVGLSGLY